MRIRLKFGAMATLLVVATVALTPRAWAQTYRIGVCIDGPWNRNIEIAELFREEIVKLTEGEFDVQFPEDLNLVGEWSTESTQRNLDQLLADDTCDLILAMGVISSFLACQKDQLDKPIIAPFIIDPESQNLPLKDGATGRTNLSYLISPFNIARDLETFYDLLGFQKLAVFFSGPFLDAIPLMRTKLEEAAEPLGVEVTYVRIDYNVPGSVPAALSAVPAGTDAAYYTGMAHLTSAEYDSLIAGINARNIPSFALLGKPDVERGVMFGLSSDDVFPKFARRVALHTQRILRGEDAGTLKVLFSGGERLTVNMHTARTIGVFPTWDVITEAELINDDKKSVAETWSLERSTREALRVNLNLAIANQQVAVGEREVDRVRSPLLPQVDLDASGTVIDQDVARAGFGSRPERSILGSASLLQVIYSENAWAPYRAQKNAQRAVEYSRDTESLNVGLEAATSFLNVLRAKTTERINKDNLRLTRENLETARVRHRVGMGGPEEVYRWEANLATGRAQVIDANAFRNVAEIDFNRTLLRPLEERFATEEVGLDDPGLHDEFMYLRDFLENPLSFRAFRGFMVQEAFKFSPELLIVEAQIDAQGNLRDGATRSFFIPEFALFGGIESLLWKDGEGSSPTPGFPIPNDTRWNVGIQAKLPLFTGGQRAAERGLATEEIGRLELERAEVAQRVEQRMRNALHLIGASSAGIRYTRDAAAAAHRNLDVITDQYARGVVSIITLLDAQNSTFLAEQRAADAQYDFFIDLMEVERAVGVLYILAPDADREAFRLRAEQYFKSQGIQNP